MLARAVTRWAPLGLRFGDAYRGAVVEGLTAWAWDARRAAGPVCPAARGSGGLLAWHMLPGFGGWVAGSAQADPWAPELRRDFSLLVVDPARRFHPVRMIQSVPHRDLVPWEWAEGDVRPLVRVYPTASQPAPEGAVAVRARLWDIARAAPAAWARLHVHVDGHRFTGLAGEDGEVVVFVAMPRPRSGAALAQQTWPIEVEVDYEGLTDPHATREAVGTLAPTDVRGDLPTLAAIERQPRGSVHAAWSRNGQPAPFIPPLLTLHGELYLASDPQPPSVTVGARETRLFVTT